MAKKALCVGINKYPYPNSDLRGCVNDANDWAELLTVEYDFARSNIQMLTDEAATKPAILNGLKQLLAGAQADDVLVYMFAGHGTYIPDVDGDEPDYDEAQCAYGAHIIDDELRELFSNIPTGVHLTVISDSCHSGSVTRTPENDGAMLFPDERRPRFLNPEIFGGEMLDQIVLRAIQRKLKRLRAKAKSIQTGFEMNEVLLSGCRAEEFSWDAKFDGRYSGAMSHHALQTIRQLGHRITYQQLHAELKVRIKAANFQQNPQLEGKKTNINRPLFS